MNKRKLGRAIGFMVVAGLWWAMLEYKIVSPNFAAGIMIAAMSFVASEYIENGL